MTETFMRMTQRSSLVMTLATVALGASVTAATHFPAGTTAGTFVGPTSSQKPYAVPAVADSGVETIALVSVGDRAEENNYAMVGIPDGLGALPGKFEQGRYVADKAYMSVFMNHELTAGSGLARLHGQNGAFVSHWTIHLN